ncbi:hypothetical protein [Blastomonas fulva]|uniref:hypothetical protein n=1 Tax=Blastomonas fulva TaxID=1550728 RepID=UPI003F705626
MSDDDPLVTHDSAADPEAMLYDFFKYPGTLSLLVLAAVLTLSQSPTGPVIATTKVLPMIGLLSLSAALAIISAHDIARDRAAGKPPSRWLKYYRILAMAALGGGTGTFLGVWTDIL